MVFIIMFDRLVITDYLTSGFCWSSGSDINSSIESEPDLSRSWGFLRDYFFADSSNKNFDSLEIDIPILKKRRYICLQRMFTSSVKTTTFGDCWQQNVISVFGVRRPIFGTWIRPLLVILRAKKWDLGYPDPKTKTNFCCQPSLFVDLTPVWCEYYLQAITGQHCTIG